MIYDLQKANIWKRISAALLDVILLLIVVTGVAWGFSAMFDMEGLDEKQRAICERYEEEYGFDARYDVTTITAEQFEALSEEQQEICQQVEDAVVKDDEWQSARLLSYNLMLIIITSSPLIAYMLLEFALPLILGNGQTVGKKVFGIAVIRFDCVKLSPVLLLVRTLLGKYTIEAMIPVFLVVMIFPPFVLLDPLVSAIVLLAFLILEIVVLCVSRTNSLLHDLLAGTVTVDLASQMIFDTPEEMLAYKKKLHEEEAERAEYP